MQENDINIINPAHKALTGTVGLSQLSNENSCLHSLETRLTVKQNKKMLAKTLKIWALRGTLTEFISVSVFITRFTHRWYENIDYSASLLRLLQSCISWSSPSYMLCASSANTLTCFHLVCVCHWICRLVTGHSAGAGGVMWPSTSPVTKHTLQPNNLADSKCHTDYRRHWLSLSWKCEMFR